MAYQESRQSLLAKIHIARKDLGLSEEVYRAMVANITGKESCAEASYAALIAMVAEMRAKGWKGRADSWLNYKSGPAFREECRKIGGKIRAILLDTERSWNYAESIAARVCGKGLAACSVPELQKIVGILSNGARGREKASVPSQIAAAGKSQPCSASRGAIAPTSVPICANGIKNAVLAYWRFQRKNPFVATECWKCDVVASDGKRLVDVEVKISWNDFRREFQKAKYTDSSAPQNPAPNRKYFAAPTELARRIAEDGDVAERGYGVLAVSDRGVVSVIRRGKDNHKGKISSEALNDIAMRLTSELITMREQVRA